MHRIETQFAGRPLVIETGRLAKQAAGSVLVQYGETVVLAAVTVSPNISHLPFFPLTVEYREKQYAAGKIPGGFLKREGRLSDDEILNCRIIDRSIRPLFPEGFRHETQVYVMVMSTDQENESDVLGVLAASAALSLSQIPWEGPIAATRVGKVDGSWILNPTFQQLDYSTMDLVVAGKADSILMVEGGALEVSEAEVVQGLKVAQVGIKELIGHISDLVKQAGSKPTMAWEAPAKNADLIKAVEDMAIKAIGKAMSGKDKHGRAAAIAAVHTEVGLALAEQYPEGAKEIRTALEEVEYRSMRSQILDKGQRIDGRDLDTVRPIMIEAGMLPRVHGSALFQRGETQALVAATLGTADDEQRIESIESPVQSHKSFMLHYNFPPFCTGEAKPIRGTSRREIGHGALAERALHPLLPAMSDFPYTIRIVS